MDHVIDYIKMYMESDVKVLKEEWASKKYKKLSECPSYSTVKAYSEANNILVNAYYNEKYACNYRISPKELIQD